MRYRLLCVQLLLLSLWMCGTFGNEDTQASIANTTHEGFQEHREPPNNPPKMSDRVMETVETQRPNYPKSHHHPKPNESYDRRPVYDVVNQPCYSAGCGGFSSQDAYPGYQWPNRNGFGQYPRARPYVPRRRGGYAGRDWGPEAGIYPGNGGYGDFGAGYGPSYPDYGYGSRGSYSPSGRYGGYVQPPYGYNFLV